MSEGRGERIAKWLARAGVASRRDAERMIEEARVRLNGRTVETPATFVAAGDTVSVDGKPVAPPERTRLFRYHKPPGLVTTHRDPEGRPTVFDKLPPGLPRLISVGRLDLTSEGLLLLTNDGELARRLELPAHGWARRYRVRVHGRVDEAALAALKHGVTVDGVAYGPIEAGLDARQGTNSWLTVVLREGKNREIRKVMQHLGLSVTRLIRTAQGPFKLGDLPRSAVEEVNPKLLRDMVGIAAPPRIKRGVELAAEAAAARAVAAEAPPPDVTPRRPPRARRGGDPGPRRRRGEVR
jgi:23S rRNA pseudouridine2605 synthase